MDGYYDPIVSHFLEKPLCLCGFWGARIPEIAVHVSSYTGIPLADLERKIEHSLGESLSFVAKKGREKELVSTEYRCLEHLLDSRPYPVVALRPETLMNPKAARLIQNKMRLIYISCDMFQLFPKVLELISRPERSRLLNFQDANPEDMASLDELFRRLETNYVRADTTLKGDQKSTRQVAHEILLLLEDEKL